MKRNIETCFAPGLFRPEEHVNSIAVIIDIFRASSAICTAFANGAASILPVADASEAMEYKSKGYLVAAERDGFVLDFADFGNSPFNFTRDKVEGKTIVYSTTNGTTVINQASSAHMIAIGSFLNLSALTDLIIKMDRDVLLFCAGWKNRFNLEDAVCAGAIAARVIETGLFTTICDSTLAAMDLWSMASDDLPAYIDKAAQRNRLRDKKLDDCIGFCLTIDFTDKIPVMKNGFLVDNIL